jgi:hypothetical protein
MEALLEAQELLDKDLLVAMVATPLEIMDKVAVAVQVQLVVTVLEQMEELVALELHHQLRALL